MADITVAVNAEALGEVLRALVGPGYHIRELQATMSLPGNPIIKLIDEYNKQIEEINKKD